MLDFREDLMKHMLNIDPSTGV